MCIQNTLQQHILDITNDGKDIAEFFYATMHGLNPNAKFHHQMDAAKHLSKLALPSAPSPSSQLVIPAKAGIQKGDGPENHENTPSPSTGEGRDGGENCQNADTTETQEDNPTHPVHPVSSTPVTDLDVINHKVARLIREETNDGYLIADFLAALCAAPPDRADPSAKQTAWQQPRNS